MSTLNKAAVTEPLLIYYGYPSLINQSQNWEQACPHFAPYRRIVLGDGLQASTHPEHQVARAIIKQLPTSSFYGYIDLGIASPSRPTLQSLPVDEIQRRAEAWKDMGAKGILLDDYGYDFGVTRERQCKAVQACHALELTAIANSWDPRHALDNEPCDANPKGLPSPLRASDAYLFESYLVQNGAWVSFKQWRAKANTLARLCKSVPVATWSVTTSVDNQHGLEEQAWHYVYACAWLEGHGASGWGHPYFAAGDNRAPHWSEPTLPCQQRQGKVRPAGHSSIQLDTESGLLVADHLSKRILLEPARPWWKRLLG